MVRLVRLPEGGAILGVVFCVLCAACSRQPSGPAGGGQATSRETASPLAAALPETVSSAGAEMVLVSGGEFQMGDAEGVDTAPVHKVAVSSFYIDKHEVTQSIYEKLMGKNPSRRKGPENPVERVRWREAIAFCNARSEAEGLRPCYNVKTGECDFSADGYRLPTEAEWEFACRGGSEDSYYFGNDPRQLKSHAWARPNAGRKTHPVGQLRPNGLGLFDMSGNVWEWCNDWYQVDYYGTSPAADPRGPAEGEKKVLRGGAFSSGPESCTSAARNCDEPGFADACVASDDFGFRCVRRAGPGERDAENP